MSIAPANSTPVKIDGSKPVKADIRTFQEFMKSRLPSIKAVAATHLRPERLFRLVIANVTKTPALRNCSMESIFRSCLQAAELGLEPGSATGEAYFVPFGQECTLITGYRGLIALAFRSGYVQSVSAKIVYQGDTFDYEEGLHPKLRHVPDFSGGREVKDITFAYAVVHLRDGGVIHDVMTRGEIDAIRKRSRASSSGPWVTDFAEMARKTVTRRCLKYAPMSVEMSKALALDEAADTGESAVMDAEFESLGDLPEGEPEETRTDRVKGKIPEVPAEPQGSLTAQPEPELTETGGVKA